jgi:hypothetical protein
MSRLSKADIETAEDLEKTPYDDPLNTPEVQPQARCLYDDCLLPGRPIGYSSVPSDLSIVSFSRKKYPLGTNALEAFAKLREKFVWCEDVLYWTATHWFLRVKK